MKGTPRMRGSMDVVHMMHEPTNSAAAISDSEKVSKTVLNPAALRSKSKSSPTFTCPFCSISRVAEAFAGNPAAASTLSRPDPTSRRARRFTDSASKLSAI